MNVILLAVAACVNVPEEQIANYTLAYSDVDKAGRAIYAEYDQAIRQPPGTESRSREESRFGFRYYDIVAGTFRDPGPNDGTISLEQRYAAMDMLLAFNRGLAAIAEGRGAEDIRAVLAPIRAVASAAGGPGGAAFAGIAARIADGVAAARSRADLVEAMTAEIRPVTIGEGPQATTYAGHPAEALLRALQDDARDMNTAILGHLANDIRALHSRYGPTPADERGMTAYATTYDDAEKLLEAIRSYRELLGQTRRYFAQLREATLYQSSTVQTAEFIMIATEIGTDARALLKTL